MNENDAWAHSEGEKARVAGEAASGTTEKLCAYLAGSGILLAWVEPSRPWPVATLALVLLLCVGIIWERRRRMSRAVQADVERHRSALRKPASAE